VRKKDRIAELEAQLEEMTRLLRMQEIQDTGSESRVGVSPETPVSLDSRIPELRAVGRGSKKRRLEATSVDTGVDGSPHRSAGDGLEIDHVVSTEVQRQLVDKYRNAP
jgi:hypothetical protein